MQTATLIHGTVKYAVDRIRNTKNGDRVKAVITADDGSDIELWDYPGKTVQALRKGEKVALTHDGKKYTLVATHPPAPANGNGHQTPGALAAATPVQHPQAAKSADVQEWVAIFQELRAALPEADMQTWRAAASTLMMIRCKARDVDF